MAGSPVWKVYHENKYMAAAKEVEAAAALCAFYGEGATIRYAHGLTVWAEGHEYQPASESYDFVASTARDRLKENAQRSSRGRALRAEPGAAS